MTIINTQLQNSSCHYNYASAKTYNFSSYEHLLVHDVIRNKSRFDIFTSENSKEYTGAHKVVHVYKCPMQYEHAQKFLFF